MINLAYITGSNTLSFSPLWSLSGISALSPDEENSLLLSLAKLRERLDSLSIKHNIKETILRYKVGETVWKNLPCYASWYHTCIRTNDTVLPCQRCNLSMGDLNDNCFNEIWNGSTYRIFRRKTLTRKGPASMDEYCDCRFCCCTGDNMQVYRLFR